MSTKVRYELIDGWPAIVYPDGRVRPVVQGGDGPTDENENDENETAPPAGPDGLDQLQNELTRIGTRENAAGRRAAERDLLQSAGFSNRDEFDRFVREAREREEAQLTETQRQQKAAEDRERQAEQRERAAAEREHRASIATALVDADVPRDRRQLVERLVDVEVGADEATIAAAIDAVRDVLLGGDGGVSVVELGPGDSDPERRTVLADEVDLPGGRPLEVLADTRRREPGQLGERAVDPVGRVLSTLRPRLPRQVPDVFDLQAEHR